MADRDKLLELLRVDGQRKARPPARAMALSAADEGADAAKRPTYLGPEAHRGDCGPLTDDAVLAFVQRLEEDSDLVDAQVRRVLDAPATRRALLASARELHEVLSAPKLAVKAIESRRALARTVAESRVPAEFSFPGYDPANPEFALDVDNTQFETSADAWGYIASWVAAQVNTGVKAEFPWHDGIRAHVHQHVFPEDGPFEVALFSDFGTGLPHSRYIAKQFATRERRFDAHIHLGDVYYVGTANEFAERFIEPLRSTLATTPLYTLNANHEMYTGGHAFFSFMHRRREAHPLVHRQQGSYFALNIGDAFTIVALDTDYFGEGSHGHESLQSWAEWVIQGAKTEGRRIILLTANEPYTYGSKATTKLKSDLKPLLSMVDLWFWGNTHYCALFAAHEDCPIGSCIGHGGYPYHRSEYDLDEPPSTVDSFAPVLWVERGGRYPQYTGLRPECGNNGYCAMALVPDGTIELTYIDWMSRERCLATLGTGDDGRLTITRLEGY
ncbi:MAG: metallophosphoesterase [Myxococcales bacterium]|nr:metallophosphoesterase [Myxococcales bacterium]